MLDQFLNTEVLQGSVSTRLMRDWIFNYQIITKSLPSPRMKKKLKIGQHLLKIWAI